MSRFLKNSILTGIFVVVPIFVSLWIAWVIYDALTSWGVELAGKLNFGWDVSTFWKVQIVRIASLLVMALLLVLIGVIARNTLGKKLVQGFQKLLLKVPIIKTKSTTMAVKNERTLMFNCFFCCDTKESSRFLSLIQYIMAVSKREQVG